MPCDYIYEVSVELGSIDKDIFKKALDSLNLNYQDSSNEMYIYFPYSTATFRNGKFIIPNRELYRVNEIKQAYSTEVVKSSAKKYGWTIKSKNKNKLQVSRRY
jgi:hypothetical protein